MGNPMPHATSSTLYTVLSILLTLNKSEHGLVNTVFSRACSCKKDQILPLGTLNRPIESLEFGPIKFMDCEIATELYKRNGVVGQSSFTINK